MYVFSWFLSIVVALVATCAIVLAMPRSAADELSVATAPHSLFSSELTRMTTMLASCAPDAD